MHILADIFLYFSLSYTPRNGIRGHGDLCPFSATVTEYLRLRYLQPTEVSHPCGDLEVQQLWRAVLLHATAQEVDSMLAAFSVSALDEAAHLLRGAPSSRFRLMLTVGQTPHLKCYQDMNLGINFQYMSFWGTQATHGLGCMYNQLTSHCEEFSRVFLPIYCPPR